MWKLDKNINYIDIQKDIVGGLNNIRENILKLLDENPTAKTQSIADELGITRRKVEYNITCLKRVGLVEREGSKKNGRWVVKS